MYRIGLFGNRRIDRFLLPTDSALTQYNLYTDKQVHYFIVALRKSTVIRIPSDDFKAYKESCREADILSDVLEYKKLKQFRAKGRLMLIDDCERRYLEFIRDPYMKPFRSLTSQQAHSDYLSISLRTITRALQTL